MTKDNATEDQPVAFDIAYHIREQIPEDISQVGLALEAVYDRDGETVYYNIRTQDWFEERTGEHLDIEGQLDFPYGDLEQADELLSDTIAGETGDIPFKYNGRVVRNLPSGEHDPF